MSNPVVPDPAAEAIAQTDLRFEGLQPRLCGEHRTLGGRAWCHDCSEYCYPRMPCTGCERPKLDVVLEAARQWRWWAAADNTVEDMAYRLQKREIALLDALWKLDGPITGPPDV